MDVDLFVRGYIVSSLTPPWTERIQERYLAFGEQQLDSTTSGGMGNGIIVALLVVAQGIEAVRRRGRSCGT